MSAGAPQFSDSHTHVVQFYESDEFLVDAAAGFLMDGLTLAQPVVLIATDSHRAAFEQRLSSRGHDVEGLRRKGHFVSADARTTLESFMSGGMPDPERFRIAVGDVISRSAAERPGRRVRAYGEMVDVLWRDGNRRAAIRLEELWNDLAATHDFSLLCAYQMGNFYRATDSAEFDEVCRTHEVVVPAERVSNARDKQERALEISRLQHRAAALEAEIEQRKELEEALRGSLAENKRLYHLATEANRVKDEFLATLSHELRTPLTAIVGWARMLRIGGLDDATVEKAVETIERSAKTQAALIDDMLDLSTVATGNLALHPEKVDVRTVVENAINTIDLAAKARQIEIRFQRSLRPAFVMGDALRLQQIAWNLLQNAVKFSPAGSTITVTVDVDTSVILRVQDAGIGIEPAFLPHVFEPFRQADSSSARIHGGLGLGLALVKHFAEIHGGTARAESGGLGSGTTLTVELPLAV